MNSACLLLVLFAIAQLPFCEGAKDPVDEILYWGGKIKKRDGRVVSVNLHRCQVTDSFMINLASLTDLEDLDLATTKVTDKGIAHIANLVNLKELHLGSNSHVSGKCLVFLKKLKNLERLDLSLLSIQDDDLSLLDLPKLRHVNLNTARITGKGLQFLEKSPNLVSIGLGYTNVTDSDLAALKKMKNLREIDLTETKITGKGLNEIKNL